MKLFQWSKDGGPHSHVWGFFFIEAKALCSVVLLQFLDGSREAYHDHAFWALTWLFKGKLVEHCIDGRINEYTPSIFPIYTPRCMFHRVVSVGPSWALSFRGPWATRWMEYVPGSRYFLILTHGRKVVDPVAA